MKWAPHWDGYFYWRPSPVYFDLKAECSDKHSAFVLPAVGRYSHIVLRVSTVCDFLYNPIGD